MPRSCLRAYTPAARYNAYPLLIRGQGQQLACLSDGAPCYLRVSTPDARPLVPSSCGCLMDHPPPSLYQVLAQPLCTSVIESSAPALEQYLVNERVTDVLRDRAVYGQKYPWRTETLAQLVQMTCQSGQSG